MPNVGTMNAAAKQVILAVAEEAADSVLWWKFCRPKFPKPLERQRKNKREGRKGRSECIVSLCILIHTNQARHLSLLATIFVWISINILLKIFFDPDEQRSV